jgi:SAM-dependent methyltransferase
LVRVRHHVGVTRDAWSSADQYEPFIGRWSRLLAAEVVAWLDLRPGLRWLDVGCGTGALSEAVLAAAAPATLVGVDPSDAYLQRAAERLAGSSATFHVGDAAALPLPNACVDVAVCGLVINFVPDAAAALNELRRVLVPGGSVAAYVWDYGDGMTMLRRFWDAAVAEDPAATALDEGVRFPVCRAGALRELCEASGLDGVTDRTVEVPMVFRDFDDYWAPFLGGQGPSSGHCVSLDPEARGRLRSRLATSMPVAGDGSISMTSRAWAVRGRTPLAGDGGRGGS